MIGVLVEFRRRRYVLELRVNRVAKMKSFGDDDELWVSQGYTKNKNKNAIRQSHDYFSMNLVGRGHAQLISSNG